MNKKRLQSIIDSEKQSRASVYVSTEVCASYSMKADPGPQHDR